MSAEQRARLAAQRAAETEPVQREAYALAARAGFDWYDTESSARRMAEHAAAELVAMLAALKLARERMDAYWDEREIPIVDAAIAKAEGRT